MSPEDHPNFFSENAKTELLHFSLSDIKVTCGSQGVNPELGHLFHLAKKPWPFLDKVPGML